MAWYNPLTWFERLPKWVKDILDTLWEIIKAVLLKVGKDALEKIKTKIVEVSKTSMSNQDKFKTVAKYIKELVPGMKDSAINLLIESLVSQLKSSGEIE